ncbi:hypothetical protein WR25_10863 [Diploscapter pachys]|uniref:JmjC domain-containing protein n=1 Tax=Diploscapter pachys TaxID=2018661 RepID=A0A2A2LR77_9BILA|nr:hypothetical protein WR25_10863 [Diploscapter pachys]
MIHKPSRTSSRSCNKYTHLCALPYLLNESKIGRPLIAALMNYASAIAAGDCKSARKNEEYLFDVGWERLNVGHYSEVDEEWRKFYAIISLYKAYRIANYEQNLKEALSAADKGLLMGRSNKDIGLVEYADELAEAIRSTRTDSDRNAFKLDVICPTSAAPSTLSNCKPIRIGTVSDLEEQILTNAAVEEPIIVRDFLSQMHLLRRPWTFDYLIDVLRDRTVPLEIGSSYSDSDWTQLLQPCSVLFEEIKRTEVAISNQHEKEVENQKPYYLAQHRLLEQLPQLREDVSIPTLIAQDNPDQVDVNAWIGPRATVSPLHTDPRHNLFVQVIGSKFLRLISPHQTDHVYPIDGMLSNTSQVDVSQPDLHKYPLFASAVCWDGGVQSGDLIYIPKK